MPAFDEEAGLERVVRDIVRAFEGSGLHYEVLVVDDGSGDRTAAVCERLAREIGTFRLERHDRHRGLGAAWRTCIGASRGEWVFVQPADGQVPPGTARHHFETRGGADVVIGVRQPWRRPLSRRMLTRVFHLITRLALDLDLPDFGACFLFRGALVRSLPTVSGDAGVAIVSEWLFLARRAGALFAERPVELLPRASGRSKSGHLRDSVATLLDLARAGLVHRALGRASRRP
jgi:glycosyltransferase involved in cell wall biosynthesis